MRPILKGSTDQSVVVRIVDSTDGTPETGVTSATSGLDLKYRREGATAVSLTESDLAAVDSAHSDGGMIHIGAGYYRIDLPDAAVATGANGVLVFGAVTGMVVIGCYVHLTDYNPQDGVRLGLTALPNAAADAAGGLPISDAGGLDMDALKATIDKLDTMMVSDTGTGTSQWQFDRWAVDQVWQVSERTLTGNVNAVLADTAHGGTSATLRLGSSSSTPALYITNSAGDAVEFLVSSGNGHALHLNVDGNGNGLYCRGSTGVYLEGVTAPGLYIIGPTDQHAVEIVANGTGDGINVSCTGSGTGVSVSSIEVTGSLTLTGAVTATNASNNVDLGTTSDNVVSIKAVTDKLDTMIVGDTGTGTDQYMFDRWSLQGVWDVTLSEHLTSGSTGSALNAAGSAGDPWATSLPGAYGAGTAGYIIGTNVDATISSRLASTSITLSGGAVTVGTNNDKTGYSISGTTTTLDALQTALNSAHGAGSWATATGFSTHTAADVWTSGTRTLTAIDEDATTLDLDATIQAAVGLGSANLDTQLGDIPTVAEFEARTLVAASYATAANQATIIGYIDTEVAAILAAVDTEVAAIKSVTDKIDTMLVSDTGTGADQWQFDRWSVDQVWSVSTRTLTSGVTVSAMDAGVITTTAIADDAITDAKIAVPAETAGRPTRILAMLRRVWEWLANKRTRDRSTGTVLLRNDADNATLETQTQSTAGDVDTQSEGA